MIRRLLVPVLSLLMASMLQASCAGDPPTGGDEPNPFLDESFGEGKEDSGYLNLKGREVHVTLEADIEAPSYRIFDAGPDLAQYAVTYLRKHRNFYLEILAEDATAPDRVEWLVDGDWLTRKQAEAADRAKLTHFRMKKVTAVAMNTEAKSVKVGTVVEAKVPRKPFSLMQDAGKRCATPDNHISLDSSVYWYLWNPDATDCPAELVQVMTLTVEEVLPQNPASYPEYDQLLKDKRLDVVVLFGKLDDGDVKDDYNWKTVDGLARFLTQAGFAKDSEATLGRRYRREAADGRSVVIDIYGPDVFASVADHSGFPNWQKAVSEHEVVMYNGHSVLGTGYAFEEVQYPDFYQIFQVASCLSYEYYVRPVLAGKKAWASVDVVSNVEPTYYSENLPLTSTILAGLIKGFEKGGTTSWQDIMAAVSSKLGHARFGVSGARDNCFTPTGSRCTP